MMSDVIKLLAKCLGSGAEPESVHLQRALGDTDVADPDTAL